MMVINERLYFSKLLDIIELDKMLECYLKPVRGNDICNYIYDFLFKKHEGADIYGCVHLE